MNLLPKDGATVLGTAFSDFRSDERFSGAGLIVLAFGVSHEGICSRVR